MSAEWVELEKKEAAELFAALSGEDELGMVLRAHTYLENELQRFIDIAVPYPEYLQSLSYSLKIKVALGCGMRSELKGPLNYIGRLRNDFAHKLGRKLSQEDANDFFNSLPKSDQNIAVKGYNDVNIKSGREPAVMDELSPRQRLSFYITLLWAAIVAARRTLQNTVGH